MAKAKLTKAIEADLIERYQEAGTAAERAEIRDEWESYSKPKGKAKSVAKAAKPKPTKYRKHPQNWKEVEELPGMKKISNHSGDSYGQRGPPGSGKRRAHDSRRARATKARVSKQKRAAPSKRKKPKKRKVRNAVGAAKKQRR